MPRRLDPKKGLPGLFAPGRPKSQDMAFLVEERPAPPKRRAKAPRPEAPPPPPAEEPRAPEPVPDYLRLAPPFRAVPVLVPREPLALREIPSLLACVLGWLGSVVRT